MNPQCSIVISSHNRLPLFRRTLWSIANRGPSIDFEVIVVDDGSTEPVLEELKSFSSRFPWKFIRFYAAAFEAQTGLRKFLNNPSVTNNIGFRHCGPSSDYIFQQGNEVIAWGVNSRDENGHPCYGNVYDMMLEEASSTTDGMEAFWGASDDPEENKLTRCHHWMVMSTTYDMPAQYLNLLDSYGQNLLPAYVEECRQWPLQSKFYRSDVTNYISLTPRKLWERIGGYDERYYGGISSEDSDFVRRARALPDFAMAVSEGVSLHQFHAGKTMYYDPPASTITKERWAEGCDINHAIYHSWNGTPENPQQWPMGALGVGEVITNM